MLWSTIPILFTAAWHNKVICISRFLPARPRAGELGQVPRHKPRWSGSKEEKTTHIVERRVRCAFLELCLWYSQSVSDPWRGSVCPLWSSLWFYIYHVRKIGQNMHTRPPPLASTRKSKKPNPYMLESAENQRPPPNLHQEISYHLVIQLALSSQPKTGAIGKVGR